MAQFVWDGKRKKTVPKSETQNMKQEQKIGPDPDCEERKPGRPKRQNEESGS